MMEITKNENERNLPCIEVPKTWNENTDPRVPGLWSIIEKAVVYETIGDNKVDTSVCNQIFGTDPISYNLLSAIIKKNANAQCIKVYQTHQKGTPLSISDIMLLMYNLDDPVLVGAAGSNFIILISCLPSQDIKVYVCDLRCCY